jgi:4,5-dihydroxyphthalate decarboxylase
MALRIGVGRYDRTAPLLDGRMRIEGVEADFVSPPPEELFAAAFDTGAFDFAELSFSNYLYLTSTGDCRYIGLPVFLSRIFRHSSIYIRTDRGIARPQDLAGRRIGVREYSMTAALVARGVLHDEFGVEASSIQWLCGPTDAYDTRPIIRVKPRGVKMELVAEGENLSDLLERGELDGMIAYKPPKCFLAGAKNVRRLFEDHAAVEQDYYRRTRIFPIMHLLGVRKDVYQSQPLVVLPVMQAFQKAKLAAMEALGSSSTLEVTLPWVGAAQQKARDIMGADYWPYGVQPNSAAIASIARYSFQQGLAGRELKAAELFAAASLDWNSQ